MQKERNTNFEIARIIAMLMIISCHLAGHGVLHMLSTDAPYIHWYEGDIFNKIFTCIMMPGAQIGTAIFLVLSGYFGINLKIKSVIRLWFVTAFYGIGGGGSICDRQNVGSVTC